MRRPATSSPCLESSPAWSRTQRREFAQNPCREPLLAHPRGAMLKREGEKCVCCHGVAFHLSLFCHCCVVMRALRYGNVLCNGGLVVAVR